MSDKLQIERDRVQAEQLAEWSKTHVPGETYWVHPKTGRIYPINSPVDDPPAGYPIFHFRGTF